MKDLGKESGIVFNIQRFSVHDGPGIRTLVFLKGCPLHCIWCSNPESQSFYPEIAYNAMNCLHCGVCEKSCSKQAISMKDGFPCIDHTVCSIDKSCRCEMFCTGGALFTYGKRMTVDEILSNIRKDEIFYSRSGGGLTLGGGEPLAQPAFALALLKAARDIHLHVGIETCGLVPQDVLLEAAGLLDVMFMDIKVLDGRRHAELTGVSNDRILENLIALRRHYPALDITVRTPVIPGINDTEEEIRAIASFVRKLGVPHYELLEYHRFGEQKYGFLGRPVPALPEKIAPDRFSRLKDIAEGKEKQLFNGGKSGK